MSATLEAVRDRDGSWIVAAGAHVAAQGTGNDKILAHIPRRAAAALALKYGGDVNPVTRLPQFDFWSKLGGVFGIGGGSSGGSSSPGNTAYSELQGQAQPLLDTGKSTLAQYNSGQLRPGDQQALTQSVQSQDASLRQLYANAGMGAGLNGSKYSSSMLINQEGSVANQAQITHQQILDSYLQQAISAYGAALGPLAQAIGYQFQGNTQSQQNLTGLIGGIFGGSGGGGIGGFFNGQGSSDQSSWFSNLFSSGALGSGGTDLAGNAAGSDAIGGG